MKKNKIICFLISCLFILSNASCGSELREEIDSSSKGDYWGDVSIDSSSQNTSWDTGSPNINITEIGSEITSSDLPSDSDFTSSSEDMHSSIEEDITPETSIYDLVYRSLEYHLNLAGFETDIGFASEIDTKEISSNKKMKKPIDFEKKHAGIIYYRDDFNLYDAENFYSAGFYEIVQENSNYIKLSEESTIYLQGINNTIDREYLCSYSYDNIGYEHFIYQNQYVQYYQANSTTINYRVFPNLKENYNLNYGSLYNYDTGMLVYDESIYDGYTPHSGDSLIDKQDFDSLQSDIKKEIEEQNKRGYKVDSINVVYISPEAIQNYLLSQEEETFFGYDVDELTRTLGVGNAVEYKDGQIVLSSILEEGTDEFNWKSFLTKIGIGAGIILVGAILTPLTGGASFGCALVTISKVALSLALTNGLLDLCVSTATNMIKGQDFLEALKNGTWKALDTFANQFMVGAVIGSVGVVSGLIKPVACFTEGTLIATYSNGEIIHKPIETIEEGDQVISYDEKVGKNKVKKVIDTQINKSDEIVSIYVNGEVINTTPNHPFYLKNKKAWIKASYLNKGDKIYNEYGEPVIIDEIVIEKVENHNVYNFTVEDTHTYYVGENNILVHNNCQTITQNEVNYYRSKAGKAAKHDALDDLVNNRNVPKYKLPRNVVEFVQKNKRFPSYASGDGMQVDFAHALDVSKIVDAFNKGLISKSQALSLMSNKQNGILVTRAIHFVELHMGKWTNTTNVVNMVKIRPDLAKLLLSFTNVVAV